MEKGFCSHLFLLLHKDATFLIPRLKFVLSTCTSQRSMHDMTATVARCHFWWNNFFFLLLLFSSFFSSITTSLLLLLTTTHTHTCRGNSERTKKMRFSSFFFFFFFYSVLLLYVWRRVCLFESLMQLFFRERQNDKEERERRRNALVSTLVSWQATIYRFAIYYRPLLSLFYSVYLSFFLFFCQQRLYANALLFAYTCHCAMFREYKHTCTNEADDDSSAIHTTKKKSLNVLMACIEKETGGKEIQWKEKLHTCMDWFNERLDIKLERMVVTDV